jgi:4-amino-4-deoxy-L-arabinose transferase-like glycosyltransferase
MGKCVLSAIRGLGTNLRRPTLSIFLLGLSSALFMILVVWPHQGAVLQTDDPYGLSILGRSIAEGRGFAQLNHPELPTMRRAPLYPGFIALLYAIGGPHTILVRLVQCVFAGGTAMLVFLIGKQVFSQQVGLLAGVLCAFHPMVLRYVPDIQVETLLTFFTTLTTWCAVRFVRTPSVAAGLAVGAAGALGALVKGVLMVCPPIFAACWLIRQWRRGERLSIAPVAAIAVAMCLVILPWTARNYRVTNGHFVPISTNAGGEFLRGYVFAQPKYYLLRERPYVEGENEANQMEIDLFHAQGLVWERDETETEAVVSKAAKQKLLAEPGAFVKKTIIGVFAFWYILTNRTNSLFVGFCALVAWSLALYGMGRARRLGREIWPLLQMILSINLLYAALLALGRYSAAVIPTLLVLAAWGLACLLDLDGARANSAPST